MPSSASLSKKTPAIILCFLLKEGAFNKVVATEAALLLEGAVKAPSLAWGHFPTWFSLLLEQLPHHKYSRYCGLSTQQSPPASFSFAYLSPKRVHPAFLVVRRGYKTQFLPMKYMGNSPGGVQGKIFSPSKSLKEKAFASYSLPHSAFRCGCLQ